MNGTLIELLAASRHDCEETRRLLQRLWCGLDADAWQTARTRRTVFESQLRLATALGSTRPPAAQ
jgi:hypothetical protein